MKCRGSYYYAVISENGDNITVLYDCGEKVEFEYIYAQDDEWVCHFDDPIEAVEYIKALAEGGSV